MRYPSPPPMSRRTALFLYWLALVLIIFLNLATAFEGAKS
jgi:hypothetical protein